MKVFGTQKRRRGGLNKEMVYRGVNLFALVTWSSTLGRAAPTQLHNQLSARLTFAARRDSLGRQ